MTGFSARQSFSTDSVCPQRSLQIWREYMREVWFRLDIETTGANALSGRLQKREFASTHVSAMAADAQRVVRSRELANLDRVESFCLVFPTQGTFEYRQRAGEAVARSGDVYILNANEPYQVDIAPSSRMLCLTLPCELVRARVKDVDDLCGQSRFADPALVSTLSHLVETTLAAEPSVDALRLQSLCLDMIDMMVVRGRNGSRGSYADAVATHIVNRAIQYVGRHLDHPDCGVVQTAGACGVSVRQLQSAFQKQGTTFSAEVLKARLVKAHQLLTAPRAVPILIGDVAAQCGFISQAHFATCYRQHYGCSPRDQRR